MKKRTNILTIALFVLLSIYVQQTYGDTFVKNDKFPVFTAQDINGGTVDLSLYQNSEPVLIIFLFSTKTGEEMATKLSVLDLQFGGKKIEILGIGFRDSEEELKQFAERLDLKYKIIPDKKISDTSWFEKIDVLPMILFVAPPGMVIERVIRGGGHQLSLLKEATEFFYRKKDFDTASLVMKTNIPAEPSVNESKDLQELKGYILSEQGKIEEAEKEFGAINVPAGLAKVAYLKGDYQKAIEYADQAPTDGYAQTIKGMALAKLGKTEEAKAILESSTDKTKYDWMKAENLNAQGRISQELGDDTKALQNFEQAVSLDPLNVVALSNKAVIHEKKGELDKAKEVLTEASKRGNDQITQLLLQQITEQIQKSNDVERQKVIQEQITQLTKQFKELKESGAITGDTWDTKPPVVAFLRGNNLSNAIMFDRAGIDSAFQRELEKLVRSKLSPVQVVERDMIDKLLQELQIGSSNLASAETQRQLGKVLSAKYLAFIEFASLGKSPMVYVRLVDTETTEIIGQCSSTLNENDILATIQKIIEEMENCFKEANKNVRGTVISVSDNSVTVNLGKLHGIKEGCSLILLQQGDPVEINGKKVGYRQIPIGKVEIQDVEDEYSTGTITLTKQDAKVEKGMKVKGTLF